MSRITTLIMALAAAALLLGVPRAEAHCDALDGPVAAAVGKALESGNVHPVLAYAPASAEEEIKVAFEKSRKVRLLGADARALADQAFLETVVRLHRAGEGAVYTGLKPAGLDYGPVIPAAERAIATGDLTKLQAALMHEVEHALHERLAHVRELKNVPLEPASAAGVARARERVSAELGFITFAETVRQAALGKGAEHHVD